MMMFMLVIMVVMVLMLMVVIILIQVAHIQLRMLHGVQNLLAVQLLPGSGDHSSLVIMLTQHLYRLCKLLLGHALGTAQYDGTRMLYLVVEKLAEVLHVHLTLLAVYNNDRTVDVYVHVARHILDCLHNVRQLANT